MRKDNTDVLVLIDVTHQERVGEHAQQKQEVLSRKLGKALSLSFPSVPAQEISLQELGEEIILGILKGGQSNSRQSAPLPRIPVDDQLEVVALDVAYKDTETDLQRLRTLEDLLQVQEVAVFHPENDPNSPAI